MKIAVTFESGKVFQHFGHTERFKVYDVENGEVALATVVNTDGSAHGALADILKKNQVDALICGGIGGGARRALEEAGIGLYGGVSGDGSSTNASGGSPSGTTTVLCAGTPAPTRTSRAASETAR